jgi:hypothetical protein
MHSHHRYHALKRARTSIIIDHLWSDPSIEFSVSSPTQLSVAMHREVIFPLDTSEPFSMSSPNLYTQEPTTVSMVTALKCAPCHHTSDIRRPLQLGCQRHLLNSIIEYSK